MLDSMIEISLISREFVYMDITCHITRAAACRKAFKKKLFIQLI